MLKKNLLLFGLFGIARTTIAQISAAQTFFQYSMTAIQPTALPYNYLDKFNRIQGRANTEKGHREDKRFKGLYLNGGARTEFLKQTGVAVSGVCAIDRIANPNQLRFQIGGGMAYTNLETVQITTPFVHVSVGKALDEEKWRLLGGVSYKFGWQCPVNKLLYRDLEDPKITIAETLNNARMNVFGVSAAIVHIEKMYLGIGVNRMLEDRIYQTFDNKTFTEANLLFQYAYKGKPNPNYHQSWSGRSRNGSSWTSNPNRGTFTNFHFTAAMRYLMSASGKYPLYAQFNGRTTINEAWWTGFGWNTANRFQFHVGFLKIPVFSEGTSKEYQFWLTYDVPNGNAPRHGAEINVGYYF
jgi:hypothetical protein